MISSEQVSLNSTDTEVLVSAIGSVIAILFIAVLLFIICKCKRRKRTKSSSSVEENNDENPVYGMYYFADGEHIDYETAEVQDDNEYYGQ